MPEAEPRLTNFDMFILALSGFSLLNIVWYLLPLDDDVTNVVLIVDFVYCLAFLTDFLMRLFSAPSKSTYFVHQRGWLDLIGSLPFPGLRLVRIIRLVRGYRPIRRLGIRGFWTQIVADRAGSALLFALFLTIVVLQYASMAVLRAENNNPDANIRTGSDAVWWAYVTVTTVGYGDRYPVSNEGRVVGIALLTIGVGLFGVLTGFLANTFLAPKRSNGTEAQQRALDEKLLELDRLIALLRSQGEMNTTDDRR
jgi:voltage-gated potassium channel Kch